MPGTARGGLISTGRSRRLTFVAISVYGRYDKMATRCPRQDRSIDIFRFTYACGDDVGRVLRVDGQLVRGIDYVGGRVALVVVRGGLPAQECVSLGYPAGAQVRGGCGGDAVCPRHGRLQGRVGVEIVLKYVIQVLGIVCYEFHPIVRFACQVMVTYEVDLPLYFVQAPVAFAGVEEVDAKAGHYVAAIALLLPVEGERIESVAAEVHHGVDLILNAFAQPSLYVLMNYMEGIPSFG